MKKIGIMTIINYDNYGNKLQNYATQEIIKKFNYEAETILNIVNYRKIKNLIKIHKLRILDRYPRIKFKELFGEIFIEKLEKEKIKKFKKFSENYINESEYKIYLDDTRKLNHEKYYKFIVGSDQVWNPKFRLGGNSNDFLCYAPKSKRISFAPSFGISHLNEKEEKNYKKWLAEIPFLSCREEAGANIIKDLTGKTAEVLVDPTMVLKPEEWKLFSSPQKGKTNQKYILTYYLGKLKKEHRKKINEIAKKYDLEIINLCDKNMPNIYVADPQEWVEYIEKAELFLTDSFHGVAFSILMRTPFIVFNRISNQVSMNSRMDTILSKFKFENRKCDDVFNENSYFDINFDHCEKILQNEREKALNYFKNAVEN